MEQKHLESFAMWCWKWM